MKFGTMTVSALALYAALAAPAAAADLNSRGGYKDAATPADSSIAGPYVEIASGFGFSSNTVSLFAAKNDFSSDGGLVNARFGYDYKFSNSRLGFGVWGEGGDNFDTGGKSTGAGIKWGENWTWGGGVKAFYDHGLGQLYVIAGYAGANQTIQADPGVQKISKTLAGFEWGTGISLKLAGNWYGKLEFDQILYQDASLTPYSPLTKWSQVDDRVLFGVGHSFGQSFTPLH
jgi:opacity protein-like surface antigen